MAKHEVFFAWELVDEVIIYRDISKMRKAIDTCLVDMLSSVTHWLTRYETFKQKWIQMI